MCPKTKTHDFPPNIPPTLDRDLPVEGKNGERGNKK